MFIDNTGKRINIDVPFTDPDTGRKGIRLTDPAERERYGITEIPDPERKNEEFYYVQTLDVAPYVLNTPKPLALIRESLANKIKDYRDNLWENGGCFVQGKWFHTDAKSKQQQLALVLAADSIPEGLQWKTLDSSFITMTPLLAKELFLAQITREQLIFSISEQKQNEIKSLNLSQLESYSISEGFPEGFAS